MPRLQAERPAGAWAVCRPSAVEEVSMVANVDAYKLSAKTFRSAGDASITADAYLASVTGGWWTNNRMPATAIVYRMGRMGLRTACHPTWGTVAIDDIYTLSRSGQRAFTVHAMVGDKVLLVQPAAYALAEFKVA